MNREKFNLTRFMMAAWVCLLVGLSLWQEMDNRREAKERAFATANALFQQNVVIHQWNSMHGGVYVPITEETRPNPYSPGHLQELTVAEGVKLTHVNPADMTRQLAELASKKMGGIRFHIASLNPINPHNVANDWEKDWLLSFERGVKEQGEFFEDGTTSWFRYMAPLTVEPNCLQCHAAQGYQEGDIRGGISMSLPYPAHTHIQLIAGYGSVTVIGLVLIFTFGSLYEKKKRLFEATFNSPNPTCVTDTQYTILAANASYWSEFGPLPNGRRTTKCYEHRPGESCHTERCPLAMIMNGTSKYLCESCKSKEGTEQNFLVTAKPLLDAKGNVAGIVESFQDITAMKGLERERERLIEELKKSLEQVKLLSGLIPICASCKKNSRRQGVLEPGGDLYRQTFGGKIQPRHLPRVRQKVVPRDLRSGYRQYSRP